MKEISDEDRQQVLSEVGMQTIRQAVKKEGMLVSSVPNMTINWHAAEVWAKRGAHDYGVSEEVLRAILIGHLKECSKVEIDRYE